MFVGICSCWLDERKAAGLYKCASVVNEMLFESQHGVALAVCVPVCLHICLRVCLRVCV